MLLSCNPAQHKPRLRLLADAFFKQRLRYSQVIKAAQAFLQRLQRFQIWFHCALRIKRGDKFHAVAQALDAFAQAVLFFSLQLFKCAFRLADLLMHFIQLLAALLFQPAFAVLRLVRKLNQFKQQKGSFGRPEQRADILFSRFGLRRFFNGEARAPHSGLDVAVPRGTPVGSVAPGKVLAVDDYFFNGKTVFVDHGSGLLSMVCHLDRIDVRPGDSVTRGQLLGLSGMTGRASGPHVHWSVVLNGVMVDPALFLK